MEERIVGLVTKLFPTFGYINNEVFFQKHSVIGPMVEVGDSVAANATCQPHLPIKWNAEQVWRIDSSPNDERRGKRGEHTRTMERVSTWTRRERPSPHDYGTRRVSKNPHSPSRDERGSFNSRSRTRSPGEHPYTARHRNVISYGSHKETSLALTNLLKGNIVSMHLSTITELRPSDLQGLYNTLAPPVCLYRILCQWQKSFPLTRPFQSSREVNFHQVNRQSVRLVNADSEGYTPNYSYYARVLLLRCPPPTELYERCVGSSEQKRPRPLTKCISMLTVSRGGLRAVGGPWIPELDGPNPISNPKTLINTAIRSCKDVIGLDLSGCTQWHRFLEFRYSRSEGQPWSSPEDLFSDGERWGIPHSRRASTSNCTDGRSGTQSATSATKGKESAKDSAKPTATVESDANSRSRMENQDDQSSSHRVVVYFIPDICSIMPEQDTWEQIKAKYQDPSSYVVQTSSNETAVFTKQKSSGPSTNSLTLNEDGLQPEIKDQSPSADAHQGEDILSANDTVNLDLLTPKTDEDVFGTLHTSDGDITPEAVANRTTDEVFEETTDSKKLRHSEIDINALKVSELRTQLLLRKLDANGLKAQLATRLKLVLEQETLEEQLKAKKEEKRKQLESSKATKRTTTDSSVVANESASMVKSNTSPSVAASTTADNDKPGLKLPILPDQPCLVVQLKPKAQHSLVVSSLESIVNLTKGNFKPCAEVYELFICGNHLLHMLHRDAVFTLYRALVVASDRKQLKPHEVKIHNNTHRDVAAPIAKRSRPTLASSSVHERSERSIASHHSSVPTLKTIDLPLLFACQLLDVTGSDYFTLLNLEQHVSSLGLPISRYQVRALAANVMDHSHRLYYRSLTDASEFPEGSRSAASTTYGSKRPHEESCADFDKPGIALSVIDDEEYLDELIKGGDAILDDSTLEGFEKSAAVILIGSEGHQSDSADKPSVSEGASFCANTFLKQLRKSEDSRLQLEQRLRSQSQDLVNLHSKVEELKRSREKIAKLTSEVGHYRARLYERQKSISGTLRQLESQANILDSTSTTLRSCVKRLRKDTAEIQVTSTNSDQPKSRREPTMDTIPEKPRTLGADSSEPQLAQTDEDADVSPIDVDGPRVKVESVEGETRQQRIEDNPLDFDSGGSLESAD